MSAPIKSRFSCIFAGLLSLLALPAKAIEINIQYISQEAENIQILSELESTPEDLALAGAKLAISENQTTGAFLDQNYNLKTEQNLSSEGILEAAKSALSQSPFLILNVDARNLLAIADLPEAQNALIFNAGAEENILRDLECRANLLHTMPSLAMRTDALVQFIKFRKWDELALIRGEHESDRAYGDSLLYSLNKFGLAPPTPLDWKYDADMRRSTFSEGPLFTQEIAKKDLLLVADEVHDFARYLQYNTWAPQILAGSEGLQSEAWAGVLEQWGAAQLQNRFHDQAKRTMQSKDYAAWAAIRAIGEGVTRINSADPAALKNFLLSAEFELAGFKGQPLSFRDWNGQLRQPMPIFHERALTTLAPLEGYQHQFSELDTLGIDRPETQCTKFGAPK